ncbi:MAG: hypothetical protein WEC15_02405 [Flavobacteriales bacterium]
MTFTKGPSIVLTYEQIEQLIDQLTEPEQLKLAENLCRKLARNKLLDLIDSMRPKKAVTANEIMKASKDARKRVQAQRRPEAGSE